MAIQTLQTIKSWFVRFARPTQQQFWDTWDSFWHKGDVIPIENIGMGGVLDHIVVGVINEVKNQIAQTEVNFTQQLTNYLTKEETYEAIQERLTGLLHFVGYFRAALPENTNFLNAGDKVIVWAGVGVPADNFPFPEVYEWDGSQFNAVGPYTPSQFDIWSNLNVPAAQPNGYYWFANKWNPLDFTIDLSDYETIGGSVEKINSAIDVAKTYTDAAASQINQIINQININKQDG